VKKFCLYSVLFIFLFSMSLQQSVAETLDGRTYKEGEE